MLGPKTRPDIKKPRICEAFILYRYGDSNPGFWHEKPAS